MAAISKVYLIGGLALWAYAGIAEVTGGDVDTAALIGALTLSLGLLQSKIRLPGFVSVGALLVYAAGSIGFMIGTPSAEVVGAVCWAVALAVEILGVLLFRAPSGEGARD